MHERKDRKTTMSYTTITLKLHNLSKCKKNVIDSAIQNYTKSLKYLLSAASSDIEQIKKLGYVKPGVYNHTKIETYVKGDVSEKLNMYSIEPMKDSIKFEFGSIMASYLRLKEIYPDTPFPRIYGSEEEAELEYKSLQDKLCKSIDAEQIKESHKQIKKLLQKLERNNSVFFCRCSPKRNFCILYDELKKRYFAKLYLLNNKNALLKQHERKAVSKLMYIHGDKEYLEPSEKKEQYIIVPLSFGKFQLQYLEKALQNPSIIKTARLFKNNDNYYLSINIKNETKTIKPDKIVGFYPSNNFSLAYAVIDKNTDEMLDSGKIHCAAIKKLNTRNILTNKEIFKQILNITAKEIRNFSVQNNCQPCLPSYPYSSCARTSIVEKDIAKHIFNIATLTQYGKFTKILDSKLFSSALPPHIRVSLDIHKVFCPMCGVLNTSPMIVQKTWICSGCGFAKESEIIFAANVAAKVSKNSKKPIKLNVKKMHDKIVIKNKLLNICIEASDDKAAFEKVWQELKKFSEDYFEHLEEHLNDSKTKKLYGVAKNIRQASYLYEIAEIN